jgi:glycosyltransferase involved in cell wall biosynthesis
LHCLQKRWSWFEIDHFDRWVAAHMTKCDIFYCFSSFARYAHKVARERYGALTVVERGSSHILYQYKIMCDEYARWGVPLKDFDQRIIEKELCEYEECDRIVVQSAFAWQTFIDMGVAPGKLIKLPFGVELGIFRPVKKEDSMFRVLYAGHCSIRKGILYLLEAVSKLRLPNFEFIINGTISPEIKELIRPYSDVFRYVGRRPVNELYHLYSQASVFVLPTIEDGFAKVIVEAMACGLPVIATTNCGASDVLSNGKEGFIVPIRDAKALADKILYLYENRQKRDEMGAAALRKAQTFCSEDSYGERVIEAYKTALMQVRGHE